MLPNSILPIMLNTTTISTKRSEAETILARLFIREV
jgi:hypothetical protein